MNGHGRRMGPAVGAPSRRRWRWVVAILAGVTTGSSLATLAAPAASTASAQMAMPVRLGGQSSANWSGYVVRSAGPVVTEVSGRWRVPTLDCGRTPNGIVASWVGIGGALPEGGRSAGPLLQTGVTSACAGTVQADVAWWERYPWGANHEVVFTGLAVAPGDPLRASVARRGIGRWTTTIEDLATGRSGVMVSGQGWGVRARGTGAPRWQGSMASMGYPGGRSAEWIVEGYEQGGTAVPLAAFGAIRFTSLSTSLASWRLSAPDAVTMVSGNTVLAEPAPPGTRSFQLVDLLGREP